MLTKSAPMFMERLHRWNDEKLGRVDRLEHVVARAERTAFQLKQSPAEEEIASVMALRRHSLATTHFVLSISLS